MSLQRLDLMQAAAPTGIRTTPQGGLLLVARPTRSGVFDYADPDRPDGVRREWRPPEEVFDAESLASLRGAPLVLGHPDWVTPENWAWLSVGHLSDVIETEPAAGTVAAEARVQRADAVAGYARGELVELSCGYTVEELEETSGVTPDGEPYDCIQRKIRYNHVGIGGENWGRAGSSCALTLDSKSGSYARSMTIKNPRSDNMPIPPKPAAPVDAQPPAPPVPAAPVAPVDAQPPAPPVAPTDAEDPAAVLAERDALKKQVAMLTAKIAELEGGPASGPLDAAVGVAPGPGADMQATKTDSAETRATVLFHAVQIGAIGSVREAAGKSTLEIQASTIEKMDGTSAAELVKKGPIYVNAYFDSIVSRYGSARDAHATFATVMDSANAKATKAVQEAAPIGARVDAARAKMFAKK